MRISLLPLFAVSLLALAACKPDEDPAVFKARNEKQKEEIAARLGPVVKAKVAQVSRLQGALASTPRAEAGAPAPKITPAPKLRELHFRDTANDGTGDVMFEGELALLKRGILGSCSYHLTSPRAEVTPYEIEEILTGCTKVRYFLVVRPTATIPVKTEDNGGYSGGEIEGDVVVFDLEGGGPAKVRGAFPVHAELTKDVKVGRGGRDRAQSYLEDALRKVLLEEIERKLGEAAAGK